MAQASRILFLLATIAIALLATIPNPPQVSEILSSDTAHLAAFLFLTLLAGLAFPDASDGSLLLALGAFGGAIELFQALPMIGRGASLGDWLIDVAAILAALLVRRGLRRSAH